MTPSPSCPYQFIGLSFKAAVESYIHCVVVCHSCFQNTRVKIPLELDVETHAVNWILVSLIVTDADTTTTTTTTTALHGSLLKLKDLMSSSTHQAAVSPN